jgi:hypothetical protein
MRASAMGYAAISDMLLKDAETKRQRYLTGEDLKEILKGDDRHRIKWPPPTLYTPSDAL